MAFNNSLLVFCCLSSVLYVATSRQLTFSPEEYWKSMLPNVPMPKPLIDILPTNTSKFETGVISNHDIDDLYRYFIIYWHNVTAEIESVSKDKKPDQIPSFYFFLEDDMNQMGKKMALDFPYKTSSGTFLPRQDAESIPFSPDKIPNILRRFDIAPDSIKATNVRATINFCYSPDIKEEIKLCTTSLESMVDFVKAQLGNAVVATSTEMYGNNTVQNYTIVGPVKKLTVDAEKESEVTCHKKDYLYAVFFCHKLKDTRAYQVPLVGEDGTKVNAIAVCHGDTAKMSPTFWAFRVLGIKPGTAPICHFLPQDHILWYN